MSYHVHTKKSWASILDDIEESFRKWGGVAGGWRADTLLAPRSATKQSQTKEERTITLHYRRRGEAYQITMTNQDRAVDNLLVIWLILETLRLNESRGYAAQIADVYRQEFPALPAAGQTTLAVRADDPYAVLGVAPGAPLAVAEAAWKALLKTAHPDHGGTEVAAARLNAAIAAIRKERG